MCTQPVCALVWSCQLRGNGIPPPRTHAARAHARQRSVCNCTLHAAPPPTTASCSCLPAWLQDGTWAGYMEVVAASHALKVNLTIYQVG